MWKKERRRNGYEARSGGGSPRAYFSPTLGIASYSAGSGIGGGVA